eukprot:jgi/Galph1/4712/GphlegSOOS_G3363.1
MKILSCSVGVKFCTEKPDNIQKESHLCLLNSNYSDYSVEHVLSLFTFTEHKRIQLKENLSKLANKRCNYSNKEEPRSLQYLLDQEDIERVFYLLGYKGFLAHLVTTDFFSLLTQIFEESHQHLKTFEQQSAETWSCQLALALTKCLEQQGEKVTQDTCSDIHVALNLTSNHLPVVILVGGTSGCGKSTLAYMLAKQLGIARIISTDTIRECLRSCYNSNDTFYGVLHSSSYELNGHLPPNFFSADIPLHKRLVKTYKLQTQLLEPYIHKLVGNALSQRESVVLEGVHLSVKVMRLLLEDFQVVVPFIVYISNESKHMNRFAVRAKYMALNASGNKYVKNFQHIRSIQEYLCKKADAVGFPKIDNTNTDRSLAAAHSVVLSCMKEFWKIYVERKEGNNCILPNIITRETQQMVWKSSKAALMDICMHRIEKLTIADHKPSSNGYDSNGNIETQVSHNLFLLKRKLWKMISGHSYDTKQLVEYLKQICSESEKDEHRNDEVT